MVNLKSEELKCCEVEKMEVRDLDAEMIELCPKPNLQAGYYFSSACLFGNGRMGSNLSEFLLNFQRLW